MAKPPSSSPRNLDGPLPVSGGSCSRSIIASARPDQNDGPERLPGAAPLPLYTGRIYSTRIDEELVEAAKFYEVETLHQVGMTSA